MKMQTKQKVALISIVGIGSFAAAVSLLRAALFLATRHHNFNPAYTNYLDFVLTATESSAGLMCACLPLTKPLIIRFTRWFQKLRGLDANQRMGWSTLSEAATASTKEKGTIKRTKDYHVQLLPISELMNPQTSTLVGTQAMDLDKPWQSIGPVYGDLVKVLPFETAPSFSAVVVTCLLSSSKTAKLLSPALTSSSFTITKHPTLSCHSMCSIASPIMEEILPPVVKAEASAIKTEDTHEALDEASIESAAIKLEKDYDVELGLDVPLQLVAYSTSPPPLIRDDSVAPVIGGAVISFDEVYDELHNQIDLSTYEYADLEDQYRKLSSQHAELKKLTTAYHNVIHGMPSSEKPDASLEQLRAEAGHEGLRAKATELDNLKSIMIDLGGLDTVLELVTTIQDLVEQAGSIETLREIVEDPAKVRVRVSALGGLDGIEHLVSQVNMLKGVQRAFTKYQSACEAPNGIRAKASKYDQLQQAFNAIATGSISDAARTKVQSSVKKKNQPATKKIPNRKPPNLVDPYPKSITKQMVTPPSTISSSTARSEAAITMNPERARLLESAPDCKDPDRDLYEPPPPPSLADRKPTKANSIPLGRPRSSRPLDNGDESDSWRKRKYNGSQLSETTIKRPRIDFGRASALIEASLAGDWTERAAVDDNSLLAALHRPAQRNLGDSHEILLPKELEQRENKHEDRVASIECGYDDYRETRAQTNERANTEMANRIRCSVDNPLGPHESSL
ncbi:hypothetical protein ACEQ8H_003589 [Pleosporales sp. CAS-2024a]